jgi:hypothetical protein
MNMDEIENKIQLEIINVNKTIANKRRGNESKENINLRANMIFCMASKQSKEERGKRKKEKKRKEKTFQAKPRRITIHVPPREEKNAGTNQMMRWNYSHNH